MTLQQRERDVALQTSLELELDVEVQPELQPHRLGLGEPRHDRGLGEAGCRRRRRERLVATPAPATAATGGDGRAYVRGGVVVVELTSASISKRGGRENEWLVVCLMVRCWRQVRTLPDGADQRGSRPWTVRRTGLRAADRWGVWRTRPWAWLGSWRTCLRLRRCLLLLRMLRCARRRCSRWCSG